MSRIGKLGIGLATAAALLLVVEGLLRWTVPETDLLFAWEHPEGMIGLLGNRVYVRASGTHTMNDGPYVWRVQTNAMGLREDGEIPPRIPPDTRRFLALGDSWVFGSSVTQGKTIPDQIEVILSDAGGESVEVVNAGIPGGSGFEMLIRWAELSAQYDFDGLILGVPHNDHRQRALADARVELQRDQDGAPYIDCRLYLVLRRLMAPLMRPMYAEPETSDDGGAIEDVRTITQQAIARGLKVWMIEWPNTMDVALGTINPPANRWRDALEPEGVVFVGHALNSRACWGFDDHGHPSEAGARAVAEVSARVMASGTSPSQLQTQPTCDAVPGVGPGKPDESME